MQDSPSIKKPQLKKLLPSLNCIKKKESVRIVFSLRLLRLGKASKLPMYLKKNTQSTVTLPSSSTLLKPWPVLKLVSLSSPLLLGVFLTGTLKKLERRFLQLKILVIPKKKKTKTKNNKKQITNKKTKKKKK